MACRHPDRRFPGTLLLAGILLLACQSFVHADEEKEPFEKIAVIGASASAGFGVIEEIRVSEDKTSPQGVTLGDLLVESGGPSKLVVLDLASGGFFMRPIAYGEASVKRAVAWKPDLVVAVDFLFWYVYGGGNHSADAKEEKAKRLEGLEKGLAVLELIESPLVIGEIPDMSLAIGGMLSRRQVPSLEAMQDVNERIHQWAGSRPDVVVVPLFELIESLRRGEAFKIGPHTWSAPTDGQPLMLPDNLHPTLRGLVALVQSIHTEAVGDEDLKDRMPDMELDQAILIQGIRNGKMDETAGSTSANP